MTVRACRVDVKWNFVVVSCYKKTQQMLTGISSYCFEDGDGGGKSASPSIAVVVGRSARRAQQKVCERTL